MLRTLEVTARHATWDPALNLNYVVSTITSPVFSEVVVFYRDYDFWGVYDPNTGAPPTVGWLSQAHEARGIKHQVARLRVFQEMHKARDFKLVLCADVWHYIGEYSMEQLKQALAAEKAMGGFGNFPCEPLVTCSPRGSRCAPCEGVSRIVTVSGDPFALVPL